MLNDILLFGVLFGVWEWGTAEFLTVVGLLVGILGSALALVWKASAANTKLESLCHTHEVLWETIDNHGERLDQHGNRLTRVETRVGIECDVA